jgi:hypothetical protein
MAWEVRFWLVFGALLAVVAIVVTVSLLLSKAF